MNKKKSLHLYWFSGSGNTLQVAETFAEKLRKLGWAVELKPLEKSDSTKIDKTAVLGIAFPTHCFSIPEIVRSFVNGLPQVDGTEAIMLGTHGAFSGGVCGPMKRKLSAKGFHCVSGRIFVLPDSFWPVARKSFNHWLRRRAMNQVERLAKDFAAGKTCWNRVPILSDIHGAAFGAFFASRKLFRKYFTTIHVRKDRCTRCNVCVQCCPVGALERDSSDSVPVPNHRCTNCLRCVAVCPVDAMRHLGFSPYRNEPASELRRHFLREIERRDEL